MATVEAAAHTIRKAVLVNELRRLLGDQRVLHEPDDLLLYAYDGSEDRALPDVVVFPDTTAHVQETVRLANRHGVPIIGRGAGTGLAGGAVPLCGGIVVSTSRMNRVLEVDCRNRRAVVEAGAATADISARAERFGFHYAPDPSSAKACTIGGNIATNAGGVHTLLYGVTTNHVLGVEFVTLDGEVVTAGGAALDLPGYDLTGLLCGSEGTLGIVTKAVVRLVHNPASLRTMLAVFDELSDCSSTVSGIIAAGILPGAMEIMDQLSLTAASKFAPTANLPTDAAAILLVEVEGVAAELDHLESAIRDLFQANHAREIRVAATAEERDALWIGRKAAFGAMGRITHNYYVMDGTIPRAALTQVLEEIGRISAAYDVGVANVFHAGDGNLHPLLLFDNRVEGAFARVIECGAKILKLCASVGGAITGEHGIGMEKNQALPMVFSPDDLAVMRRVRDIFNPRNLFNPGKIFPDPVVPAEVNTLRHGDAPTVIPGAH